MFRYPLVLLLCCCGTGIPACGAALRADTPASFVRDIVPVLQKHCVVCHSEPLKSGGLLMGTHARLMAGGQSGAAITPGKGQDSLLVKVLDGRVKPQMPQGGAPLDSRTIALIRAWIDAGAKGPAPGEAAPEVAPPVIPDIKPRVPVSSQVGALAFRSDGSLLAVGRYKQVQFIETASRNVVATLEGHADVVRALAFSPDGRLLAAAGGLPARKGEIRIWNVEARRELRAVEGHADSIYSVAFSPDGKRLASTGYDKLVKLWDVTNGREERTLKDHTDAVFALPSAPTASSWQPGRPTAP